MTVSHSVFGSIIGLKPEFEERYIVLHKHTFPGVIEQIRKSGITDYSIFLKDGLLFSHMLYSGSDFQTDSVSMGEDSTTREWWKLTDPMQQPQDDRKDGEWWTGLELIREYSSSSPAAKQGYARHAFTVDLPEAFTESQLSNKDEEYRSLFSDMKCLRVFRSSSRLYIYVESYLEDGIASVASRLGTFLRSNEIPVPMKEVFHTGSAGLAAQAHPKKVFVTGCFDMLHSGHIAFLQEAAGYGEVYVCIGSDANVENLKGRFPVNNQVEREYMLNALDCVQECRVNTGWGYIDFENELQAIRPDIFIVNEDGHSPTKQQLCNELGIAYKILKRIPHADLPARSTTALRTECTIPYRIDLAGGWLDQPFVSGHYPGPVITISIEPTVTFNERSGMASSTRRKAIELWRTEIPLGNAEQLARMLFSYENPPGTKEVAGSQDALGIVLPGLNKLDYDGNYWPEKITSVQDEEILCWLETNLYLVTLGPRFSSYSVIDNTRITPEGAAELSQAAQDCWLAIHEMHIEDFGKAFRQSFDAQVSMFPNMVDADILNTIEQYKDIAWGWKLSGAGGGGYLILVSDQPVNGAMQIKVRRRNTF
jgi:cytidyltransferase-like protein